ncbi:hypothetical protein GYB59_22215 [bacterium]|nr:hypothetical protein [bacterium]
MKSPVIKEIKVDDRMESYCRFYSGEWAFELSKKTAGASKLKVLFDDLWITLKGISNMFSIPQLSVDLTEMYFRGMERHIIRNSTVLELINHISARVEQRNVLSQGVLTALKKEMLDISSELKEKTKNLTLPFTRSELWDSIVKVETNEEHNSPRNEYRLAIWSTCRICFSSLFFAYEDFFCGCIEAKTGRRPRTGKGFNELCVEVLGDTLAEDCWCNDAIVNARLIRNSIVHAGGRVTSELENRMHGMDVIDGEIQVLPTDVKCLYNLIENNVTSLVDWGVRQPEIVAGQAPA